RGRQPDADQHDPDRRRAEGDAGAALEERDAVGADDVNDQRLREERLDEPSRLEERRTGRVPAAEHTVMTAAARTSPVARETMARTARSRTRGFRHARSNRRRRV